MKVRWPSPKSQKNHKNKKSDLNLENLI